MIKDVNKVAHDISKYGKNSQIPWIDRQEIFRNERSIRGQAFIKTYPRGRMYYLKPYHQFE